MSYISQYKYYENEGNPSQNVNWGSYQYVSLGDIVNNFQLMYSGNHSLINNEPRFKILFHAKRAIQELNYDALKEVKNLGLTVPNSLIFIFPSDYVNWVRISLYKDGVLRPLSENIQTLSAKTFLQDSLNRIIFDENGDVTSPEYSEFDLDRLKGIKKSIYMNQNSPFNGQSGYNVEGRWLFDCSVGASYGLNTETANINPTFSIENRRGVINFDSSMSGEYCVLEYISDGMEAGDESLISINKMFESYIYAAIEYEILSSKLGVQEYIINRARKKRRSLLDNAKIRMSNIKPGRLLMNLRGMNKQIK